MMHQLQQHNQHTQRNQRKQHTQHTQNKRPVRNLYSRSQYTFKFTFEVLTKMSMRMGNTSDTNSTQITWLEFLNMLTRHPVQQIEDPIDHQEKAGARIKVSKDLIKKIKSAFSLYDSSTKKFLNPTSVLQQKTQYLDSRDFLRAYEMLNTLMFQNKEKYHQNMFRFQGIGLLFLEIITGKCVSLLDQRKIGAKVSMYQAHQLVSNMGQKFQEFIKRQDVCLQINSARQKSGVDYFKFLNRIFKDQCKDLTWKQLLFLLVRREGQSSEDNPDVQGLLVCESQQNKKLLRKAEIVQCDKDKKEDFLARPDLYLTLLERFYNHSSLSFRNLLKRVKATTEPQAFLKAISQVQQEQTENPQNEEDWLFIFNYYNADSIEKFSKKVYQVDRDRGKEKFVVKLFPYKQFEDIQLIKDILERRKQCSKCSYMVQICGDFKHSDRLGLISPISTFQPIKKISVLRPAYRKIIISDFFRKIFKGDPCLLYSLENTSFANKYIHFNQSSIVGLMPLIKINDFEIKDLKQVYELLDLSMFGENNNNLSLITQKSKFRAIAMLILFLITGERVSLLEKDDFEEEEKVEKEKEEEEEKEEECVQYEKVRELVAQIPERFRNYQSKAGRLKSINHAEIKDGLKYQEFLRQVFQNNCKKMNWSYAASLLFRQYEPRADEWLRRFLRDIAQALFLKEDYQSRKALLQLGIVKEVTKGHFELIDEDTYLHYLMPNASYRFASVADQICQRKYSRNQQDTAFDKQFMKLLSQIGCKKEAIELLLVQMEYFESKKISKDIVSIRQRKKKKINKEYLQRYNEKILLKPSPKDKNLNLTNYLRDSSIRTEEHNDKSDSPKIVK